ncbi:MAG: hypothetical protein DRJ42_04525 [Deltaproteobacteria bacterium]|nr:MAG: hypothetical protein DRJ42_04525 [Deltaproteobacteria bacterium]
MWLFVVDQVETLLSGELGRGDTTMTYDNRIHFTLTVAIALFAGACTSSMERSEFTKDEARSLGGSTDLGADICASEGWYDDGECDEFCAEPDGDCDATCFAYPSCEVWETEHERWEDCPADASCREETLCGATVWCSDGATCPGVPSCGDGETAHESWQDCPADASCREESVCGATIWCSSTGATCLAYPSCDEGETAHERWEDCPADASCREVTLCSATIWCSADEAPVCPGDNPEGCLDRGCAEGFVCDTTMGTAPSGCVCEPETGTWLCTADLNGGICVPDGA